MYRHIKTKSILLSLLLIGFFAVGCDKGDDSSRSIGGDIEITETLPEGSFDLEVKNVKAASETHQLVVSWDEPEGAKNLSHYLVEWKGSVTDKPLYSQTVKKGTTSLKAGRLFNEEYEITVKCISSDLLSSAGVSTKGSPVHDTTAPGTVTDLKGEPLATSAVVSWKNPLDADLERTKLVVFDITNNKEMVSVELPPSVNFYQMVGLEEQSEYKVSLSTSDYIGNTSAIVEESFRTLTEKLLVKTTPWEIIDFSQEEASGEGATGRAKDAIDGNDATYWHSPWTGGGSSLPQWIVFDIKQEVIPTVLISYKRDNNNNGPTLVKVEGSLDLEEWFDFGNSTLIATVNEGQNCYLKDPKKVRYIRYTVLASPNNYAMVRNINIRALVE